MNDELAIREDLAIEAAQTAFTPPQRAALAQLGIDGANDADLAIFFHQCKRTGLDPFVRQIHMISRNVQDDRGNWVKKWTIQTGIDGYRLVARRAADRLHESLEVKDTLWCGPDKEWSDVWIDKEPPAAAKVTVVRGDKPFTFVAVFSEYAQYKRDGNLNSMWAKMTSNQLGKCAEAGALRKAYPQDLSGVYIPEEMSDDPEPTTLSETGGNSRLKEALAQNTAGEPAEPAAPEPAAEEPAVEPDPWQTPEVAAEVVPQVLVQLVTDDQLAAIAEWAETLGLAGPTFVEGCGKALRITLARLEDLTIDQADELLEALKRRGQS